MKTTIEILERIVRHLAAIEIERTIKERRREPNLSKVREYFIHEELLTSHLDELDAATHFEAQEKRLREDTRIGGTD